MLITVLFFIGIGLLGAALYILYCPFLSIFMLVFYVVFRKCVDDPEKLCCMPPFGCAGLVGALIVSVLECIWIPFAFFFIFLTAVLNVCRDRVCITVEELNHTLFCPFIFILGILTSFTGAG
jgi:hypothetical protein